MQDIVYVHPCGYIDYMSCPCMSTQVSNMSYKNDFLVTSEVLAGFLDVLAGTTHHSAFNVFHDVLDRWQTLSVHTYSTGHFFICCWTSQQGVLCTHAYIYVQLAIGGGVAWAWESCDTAPTVVNVVHPYPTRGAVLWSVEDKHAKFNVGKSTT